MESTKHLARRAGLLYLLSCLPAPFSLLYVPSVLIVPGNAVETAHRVRAHEGLLRAGVVADLVTATLAVFAVLALYQLFKNVGRMSAMVMAAMMLLSLPITLLNVVSNLATLVIIKSPAFQSNFTPGQVAALVTLFLRLHAFGAIVAQILLGLWLFPYGALIVRSGFIPRWLAYPLMIAGAGYVINSLGEIILPASLRWVSQNALILGVGEVPILVWLLIWGARSSGTSSKDVTGESARAAFAAAEM